MTKTDTTKRYITKIARVAQQYAGGVLRQYGIGLTEYECLRILRKNEGINQEQLGEMLNINKAAVTRMISNLENKGYVVRRRDEFDKRVNRIFPTHIAPEIKFEGTDAESMFYEWLMEDISPDEAEVFVSVLERLYVKSKNERREGFHNLKKNARE